MAVYKVMERLFSKCGIRNAIYRKNPSCSDFGKYEQKHFCIDREEDFVWIDEYEKSLLKDEREEHKLYDENPYLLIYARRFDYLFNKELEQLSDEIRLPSVIVDNLVSNLWRKLIEMRIIYKKNRSDSKWGRPLLNYPVYELEECKQGGYYYRGEYVPESTEEHMKVYYEPVIRINTKLSCIEILKERMDNEEFEEKDRNKWKIQGGDDMLKIRQEFKACKFLYKE